MVTETVQNATFAHRLRAAARRVLPLGLVLGVAALLRSARIAEAPGGFFAFNEGFYLQAALREIGRGPFAWFVAPDLLDKPPLYVGALSALLRFDVPHFASARLISVAAGLVTVGLTYVLGRMLYDRPTGLAAAAMLAVMPGVVLVDHNIQVDPLMVALMMGGLVAYVHSTRTGRTRDGVAAGVLLGLAILTKQPAALILPAVVVWETWNARGLSWLRNRRVALWASTALAVGGSWYVLQAVTAPGRLLEGMMGTGGRSEMSGVGASFWLRQILPELAWMAFPLAAIVAAAGLVLAARRHTSGDRLVIVSAAAFLLYYVGFHLHPYYLLPTAPFLALAIGRVMTDEPTWRLVRPSLRLACFGILLALTALGAVLMMAGHKWGRWSPAISASSLGMPGRDVRLYQAAELEGGLGPSLALADPDVHARVMPFAEAVEAVRQPGLGETRLLLSEQVMDPEGRPAEPAVILMDRRWRPVLFGCAIGQWPDSFSWTQVFTNARWTVQRVGPVWRFGSVEDESPSGFFIYDAASFP
jgi:4-amino-4-deoxy-L-arabinose transferase-like glycosyltransferase